MSVINRMLRDLDARQQRPASGAPMAAIAPRPRSRRGWLLGVLIAASLGLGTWYWWQHDHAAQQSPTASIVTELATQSESVQVPTTATSDSPERVAAATTNSASIANPAPVEVGSVATAAPQLAESEAQLPMTATVTEPAVETPTAEAEPEPQPVMKVERRQLTPAELIARYQQQAREAQQRGALETAAERYQQILALKPNHTETRQQLAALWYGQGYGSRSVALLREGLSLSANDTQANIVLALTLARIHERLAQPEQAYAVLQRLALNQDQMPATLEALAQRAELARQLGQYQQAVADYEHLLQRQPDQARWYLAQAVAYEQLAQWAAARTSYQQAQQLPGLSAQSYEFIATRITAINQQLASEEEL